MDNPDTLIYVGPTGWRVDAITRRCDRTLLRPPVSRGDIERDLVSFPSTRTLVIVDGRFGDVAAVGHRELLRCVDRGMAIWGLSSIGAIRAAEMYRLGVQGFGRAYHQFRSDPDLPDDEVTLLHFPEAPYFPVSEPMLHLREALRSLAVEGIIAVGSARAVERQLESRWFGDRTIDLMSQFLVQQGEDQESVSAYLGSFDRFRIKSLDLAAFLELQHWRT